MASAQDSIFFEMRTKRAGKRIEAPTAMLRHSTKTHTHGHTVCSRACAAREANERKLYKNAQTQSERSTSAHRTAEPKFVWTITFLSVSFPYFSESESTSTACVFWMFRITPLSGVCAFVYAAVCMCAATTQTEAEKNCWIFSFSHFFSRFISPWNWRIGIGLRQSTCLLQILR